MLKTSNGLKIDFVTLHDLSSITMIIQKWTETQTILFHDDYDQTLSNLEKGFHYS